MTGFLFFVSWAPLALKRRQYRGNISSLLRGQQIHKRFADDSFFSFLLEVPTFQMKLKMCVLLWTLSAIHLLAAKSYFLGTSTSNATYAPHSHYSPDKKADL
jgi:hypothetical protein